MWDVNRNFAPLRTISFIRVFLRNPILSASPYENFFCSGSDGIEFRHVKHKFPLQRYPFEIPFYMTLISFLPCKTRLLIGGDYYGQLDLYDLANFPFEMTKLRTCQFSEMD